MAIIININLLFVAVLLLTLPSYPFFHILRLSQHESVQFPVIIMIGEKKQNIETHSISLFNQVVIWAPAVMHINNNK